MALCGEMKALLRRMERVLQTSEVPLPRGSSLDGQTSKVPLPWGSSLDGLKDPEVLEKKYFGKDYDQAKVFVEDDLRYVYGVEDSDLSSRLAVVETNLETLVEFMFPSAKKSSEFPGHWFMGDKGNMRCKKITTLSAQEIFVWMGYRPHVGQKTCIAYVCGVQSMGRRRFHCECQTIRHLICKCCGAGAFEWDEKVKTKAHVLDQWVICKSKHAATVSGECFADLDAVDLKLFNFFTSKISDPHYRGVDASPAYAEQKFKSGIVEDVKKMGDFMKDYVPCKFDPSSNWLEMNVGVKTSYKLQPVKEKNAHGNEFGCKIKIIEDGKETLGSQGTLRAAILEFLTVMERDCLSTFLNHLWDEDYEPIRTDTRDMTPKEWEEFTPGFAPGPRVSEAGPVPGGRGR
jgi:hypothetical protein